jgi:2'-5' RNA ligase
MAESALIVVAAAMQTQGRMQDVVRDLRARYDPSAALGVPPHITVLYPFVPPDQIDSKVLVEIRRAVSNMRAFEFALAKAGRFAATAYLAPEPSEPFVELTRSIMRGFPTYPPYAGEHAGIEPHLTVSNGSADDAIIAHAALIEAIAESGPIHAICDALVLIENASGRWKNMYVFPFPIEVARP